MQRVARSADHNDRDTDRPPRIDNNELLATAFRLLNLIFPKLLVSLSDSKPIWGFAKKVGSNLDRDVLSADLNYKFGLL